MFRRQGASVHGIRGFFCWLIVLSLIIGRGTVSRAAEEPLQLYANAAVLLDGVSGRVLYEKNGDTPMAMASTTKIMTCILVLENGELEDQAQVSAYAASMPKVKMNVQKGEQYEVRNLLFSMMLESHNDAAVVLAEYIGSRYMPEELREKPVADYTTEESKMAVKAFATLMNEKAAELGCTHTWFITPNGLDATETVQDADGRYVERDHETTAAELARIMMYCVRESPGRDVFREITRTESYSFYENGKNVSCVNHNQFLTMMEGAFSGKTGYTNKAGYCYVGALEDDGRVFIVALLGCGWPEHKTYKWSDTRTLMQYGLDNYSYQEINGAKHAFDESLLKPIPVENGQTPYLGQEARVALEVLERHGEEGESAQEEPITVLLHKDEKIQVDYVWEKHLQAPVPAGMQVGTVTYRAGDTVYMTETIVTKSAVGEADWKWCVEQVLRRFVRLKSFQ